VGEELMAKPRGKPFEAGNTAGRGRPLGSRNKTTVMLESMLNEYGPAVLRKCLAKALEGDGTAMRLVMERLLPPARDTRVQFRLPKIKSSADLVKAGEAVLKALAAGELGIEPAKDVLAMFASHGRILEEQVVEQRVSALEQGPSSPGTLETLADVGEHASSE
jgi:hypothetical protein